MASKYSDLIPGIFLFIICGLSLTQAQQKDSIVPPGETAEYCEDEFFRAKCEPDEVILIENALYGRMNLGRCVTRDMGNIGCAVDVTMHLDRWCSGKRQCNVEVSDLMRGAQKPCPRDFRSYLEASYTCVKVLSGSQGECRSSSYIEVTQAQGYIASLTTEETGCGSIDTPWLLRVPAGNNINITLLDFDLVGKDASQRSTGLATPCHVYAIIKEKTVTASRTICSQGLRTSHVFTSSGNSVEVRVVTKRQKEDHGQFVLQFQATGCADLTPPRGATFRRRVQTGLVECTLSGEKWQLTCHRNKWIGQVGNCSKVPTPNAANSMWGNVTSSQGLSIAIIVGVAVIVGVFILVFGLVCLKWQRTKRGNTMEQLPQAPYSTDTTRSYASSNVEKGRDPMDPYGCNENNYYRTWQIQQRANQGGGRSGSIKNQELPPPPYHPVSTGSGRDYRYVEHVYESPKFDRHPEPIPQSSSGELSPTNGAQYFELDPDVTASGSVPMTSASLPRGRMHSDREPDINWIRAENHS